MTARSLVGILLVAVALTGCLRAPDKATSAPAQESDGAVPGSMEFAAPPQAPEPEPRTLEEAEAAFERARAELEATAFYEAPATQAAPAAPAAGAPPPPARTPVEESRRAEASADSKGRDDAPAEAERKAESPCDTACKAFASLRRARDAVCRLDAPNGERCTRADGILRDAGTRITSCRCAP